MATKACSKFLETIYQQELCRLFSSEFSNVKTEELAPFIATMRMIQYEYKTRKPEIFHTLIMILQDYQPQLGAQHKQQVSKYIKGLLSENPELAEYLISILPEADVTSNSRHAVHTLLSNPTLHRKRTVQRFSPSSLYRPGMKKIHKDSIRYYHVSKPAVSDQTSMPRNATPIRINQVPALVTPLSPFPQIVSSKLENSSVHHAPKYKNNSDHYVSSPHISLGALQANLSVPLSSSAIASPLVQKPATSPLMSKCLSRMNPKPVQSGLFQSAPDGMQHQTEHWSESTLLSTAMNQIEQGIGEPEHEIKQHIICSDSSPIGSPTVNLNVTKKSGEESGFPIYSEDLLLERGRSMNSASSCIQKLAGCVINEPHSEVTALLEKKIPSYDLITQSPRQFIKENPAAFSQAASMSTTKLASVQYPVMDEPNLGQMDDQLPLNLSQDVKKVGPISKVHPTYDSHSILQPIYLHSESHKSPRIKGQATDPVSVASLPEGGAMSIRGHGQCRNLTAFPYSQQMTFSDGKRQSIWIRPADQNTVEASHTLTDLSSTEKAGSQHNQGQPNLGQHNQRSPLCHLKKLVANISDAMIGEDGGYIPNQQQPPVSPASQQAKDHTVSIKKSPSLQGASPDFNFTELKTMADTDDVMDYSNYSWQSETP